jgi:serine/threonine protein kinase/Flp pilus assembly protein TadD
MRPAPPRTLDSFVEAFEQARRDRVADPSDFAPGPGDPLRLPVLRELLRVDLEAGWAAGAPRPLDDYRAAFPDLFADPEAAADVAFEEYRQRLRAGQRPSREDYARRYGVATDSWPTPPDTLEVALVERTRVVTGPAPLLSYEPTRAVPGSAADAARSLLAEELSRYDPPAAERLQRGLGALPEVGDDFAGFRLVAQLGRGAFGTVFLARQGELADRPVALKVAADLGAETRTLAQLLHAHIVPVYSVHRRGPLHAFCMPYLGRTTLADVLRRLRALPAPPARGAALLDALDAAPGPEAAPTAAAVRALLARSTFAEAVLWLGARLADGLAHAHERGVLHHDLKPANVLITDEGQPMLLDFNLAEDTKTRAVAAQVGGTLPYMAPEQMEAFRGGRGQADARADLFSLGVLLFQLLAGRDPYPERGGPTHERLPLLIADRQSVPRLPRAPGVTPAVEAIVRRCLEPGPDRRYQSAADLRDDLERQRADLPLRHAPNPSLRERLAKWARRHPRLTSSTSVAALAGLVLAGLTVAFAAHLDRQTRERAAEAEARAEEARARADAEARARARDLFEQTQRDVRRAQYDLVTRTGDPEQLREGVAVARRALGRYGALDGPGWRDRDDFAYLSPERQEELRADLGELLLLLARAADLHPAALGADGGPGRALERARLAVDAFGPERAPPTLWRLLAKLAAGAGHADEAADARARAARAPRTLRDSYLEGAEHAASGRYREALPPLTELTRRDPQNFLAWYVRGYCHHKLGQFADAVTCATACVALRPDDARPYYNRGLALLSRNDNAQDNQSAAADFTEAIRLAPGWVDPYAERAFARHERLNDPRGAVADRTRLLTLRPDRTDAYFDRAAARRAAGDAVGLAGGAVVGLVGGAAADEAEGLRRPPDTEAARLARSRFLLAGADAAAFLGDRRAAEAGYAAALADLDDALRLNPRSFVAIRNKAFLLAERLDRVAEAVEVLDGALGAFPDSTMLRMGRAVYLARLGRRDDAIAEAGRCLLEDRSAATEFRVACVYALTARQRPDDRGEALHHLAVALRKGFDRLDKIRTDRDLDAVRGPDLDQLLLAAGALRR